ncbi:MAG TPA: DUF4097 family beta strand repeat-containing protein [Candidatus Hodarchaeales archaeon]|nr:DUF4097 family beta strand repeat-containing protein [Candidatus Hodarchaeales archaeon]
MSAKKGSIVGSVVLIALGIIFFLRNIVPDFRPLRWILKYWPNFWLFLAKFWPVILILWGVYKLYCYFAVSGDLSRRRKSLMSGGDVVLLIFLLLFGTAVTSFTHVLRGNAWPWSGEEINIHGGDGDFDLFGARNKFEFVEESSKSVKVAEYPHLTLRIENKYGRVEVFSHDQSEIKVKLKKTVAVDDEPRAKEIASALKIVFEGTSTGYVLSSSRENLDNESRRGLVTDFSVWVPKSASVSINNSYGPVNLQGITGDQEINNSYGPVVINDIEGSLRVENKYAPVTATNITGSCQIVGKYGPVDLNNVGGKTDVENAYGAVSLKRIKGPVSLSNRYSDVLCQELESSLSIEGRHVGVLATNVGGDVQVLTSFKDVKLENILGGIRVQGKHGDIEIKSQQPPIKPISVDSDYSLINITLPRESNFEVDASSKYGKFVCDFQSAKVRESSSGKVSRFRGSYWVGGPTLTLVTSYHDIRINPS